MNRNRLNLENGKIWENVVTETDLSNRTNLEHGEQIFFGTQRTEQIRNMENRTREQKKQERVIEHGEQN